VHTLTVTLSGLFLLFVFLFVANSINKRKNKRVADGAHIFIWFWLLVSIINFYVGVFVANYSFATEVGVHLVIFGVPAAVAWYLSRSSVAKDNSLEIFEVTSCVSSIVSGKGSCSSTVLKLSDGVFAIIVTLFICSRRCFSSCLLRSETSLPRARQRKRGKSPQPIFPWPRQRGAPPFDMFLIEQ
jgi:hypothetical protein